MRIRDVDFPGRLLDAQRTNSLVVFAGAGVSMSAPSNFPGFKGLAQEIVGQLIEPENESEPMERFLGRAHSQGVRVHESARAILSDASSHPNPLHYELLKLFPNPSQVHVVTTNFDAHFSTVASQEFGSTVDHYYAPALPVGDRFHGIVYLHGSITQEPERIVLTDSDFGRAYLTEGWARRFLQDMFARYTVLFVGYSHEDTVMNYLARGLPPDRQGLRFALVDDGQDPDRWRFRGVTPILFPRTEEPDRYSSLREAVTAWAARARMGTLEHERQIEALVAVDPPLDPEMSDYLAGAIKAPVTIRFFVRHARLPIWLDWAEGQDAFRELFRPSGYVDDISREMAGWFANDFVCEHPEEALALVERQGQQLHSVLWQAIGMRLASADPRPDAEVLANWVLILLASTPYNGPRYILDTILQACRYPADAMTALLLFEHLTRPWPHLSRTFTSRGIVARPEIEILGEMYIERGLATFFPP